MSPWSRILTALRLKSSQEPPLPPDFPLGADDELLLAMGALADSLEQYGRDPTASQSARLRPVYLMLQQVTEPEYRITMLRSLAEACARGDTRHPALYPFFLVDTDPEVIKAGVLYAAQVWADDARPLTGAQAILEHVDHMLSVQDEWRAELLLKGLLLLGDRRVLALLPAYRRRLSPEARMEVTRLNPQDLHAPLIEWFLDWLGECEGSEFGAVAGRVGHWGLRADTEPILEATRPMPRWNAVPDEGDACAWDKATYIKRIGPILREIAATESGEWLVMPHVLKVWGLEPGP